MAILLSFLLVFQQAGLAQVASSIDLSGKLATLRQGFTPEARFRPLHLRYLSYDSINNNFKLLVDKGTLANPKTSDLESASKDLLKYFFIGLALPNDTFWVNLRPDSPDQIIDPLLEQTDIGRILLEADVELKKDTASATSPDTKEGKVYWDKLYQKAGELFGTTEVTIPTLTRPWIVPDEVIISESSDSAYIYKATLKVMLEEDYLKQQHSSLRAPQGRSNLKDGIASSLASLAPRNDTYDFKDDRAKQLNAYSTQLIKELILPKITQSINTGKKYASLRQVYYSLILASWFKSKFQANPGQYSNLIDSKDLSNLTTDIAYTKDTYFKQYQKSFQSGEYKFQIPTPTPQGQVIRSYFSGGVSPIPSMPPEGQTKAGITRTPRQRLRTVPDSVIAMLARDVNGQVIISKENVEKVLGRTLEDDNIDLMLIRAAHKVESDRSYKQDKTGRPVKNSDPDQAYTKEGIAKKAKVLSVRFSDPEERRKLMEAGLAGRADRDQPPLAQIIARINIEHGATSEGARQVLVALNAASAEYDTLSIRAAKDAVNILKVGSEHGLTHSEKEVCAQIKAIIEERIIRRNFKGIVGQIKYELEGRIEIVAMGIQAQEGGDLPSPARNDAQPEAGSSKEAGPRADPLELIVGSLQGGMDAGIAASLVEASGCSFEEFQRISDGLMEMASSWKVMREERVRSFPTGLEVFSFFMYLAQDKNIDPRIRSLSQGNLRPLERILGQEWRNEIAGLIETDRRASQDLPQQGDISTALDRLARGAQTEEDVPFLTRSLGINSFGKWGARGADHASLALEASVSQNPRLGMILQHLLRKALDSKDTEKANRIIDLMIVWSGRELEATQVFLALAAEQMHLPLPQLLDERLKAHGQYVSEEDAWIFGGFFERAEKLKKLYARLEGKYVADGGLILEKDSLKSKALVALAGVIKNPRMRKTIADTIASAIFEARQLGMSVGFSMMEEIGGMIEGELTKDELRQKSGIIWDALSEIGFYDHEIGGITDVSDNGLEEPEEGQARPARVVGRLHGLFVVQYNTRFIYVNRGDIRGHLGDFAQALGKDKPTEDEVLRYLDGHETLHALIDKLRSQDNPLSEINEEEEERLAEIFGRAFSIWSGNVDLDLIDEVRAVERALRVSLVNELNQLPRNLEALLASLGISVEIRVATPEEMELFAAKARERGALVKEAAIGGRKESLEVARKSGAGIESDTAWDAGDSDKFIFEWQRGKQPRADRVILEARCPMRESRFLARMNEWFYSLRGASIFPKVFKTDVSFKASYAYREAMLFITLCDNMKRDGSLPERIYVYEFGPGNGNNAFKFLSFLRLHNPEYYQRVKYRIFDASEKMLEDIKAQAGEYLDKLEFVRLDVTAGLPQLEPAALIRMNELLDDLYPTGMLGRDVSGKYYEYAVECSIDPGSVFPRKNGPALTAAELADYIESGRISEITDIDPSFLEKIRIGVTKVPVEDINAFPYGEVIAENFKNPGPFIMPVNIAACRFMESLAGLLLPGYGQIICRDYGELNYSVFSYREDDAERIPADRYGGQPTVLVNFSLIKNILEAKGTEVVLREPKLGEVFMLHAGKPVVNFPKGPLPSFEDDANEDYSSSNPQQRETGGIDFRFMPIVVRAMADLSAGAAGISMSRLKRVDLGKEWSDIEQLVSSGIAPSGERIKEYLQASSAKGELDNDIDKVLTCISEVFRLEEDKGSSTDEVLRDVLVVLEASRSSAELTEVLVGAEVS